MAYGCSRQLSTSDNLAKKKENKDETAKRDTHKAANYCTSTCTVDDIIFFVVINV